MVPYKFRNAGQVCVAPTRFIVQQGIFDDFAEGFARRAAALKVGNGLDPDVRMGPMANARRRRPWNGWSRMRSLMARRCIPAANGSAISSSSSPTVLSQCAARRRSDE
ncbi:aldehyde dehydrogenase family protein, partial [Sphingobium sp. Ant17]|uniref:aldehyde dehydrogenase family protein n=1 Tax=Sphingobium sp. Ant17 TaxID=1461752 RepID=UPI002286B6DD